MINIDVKTLFIFSALANIFIIGLFVTYIKLYKVKNHIINIFIFSRILGIIFLFLLAFREGTPKPIGIILNTTINIFIIFYEVYCISFIERKFDSKHFKKFIFIPLFFAIIVGFFSTSSISSRIAIVSLSVAIMYILAGYILLTEKGKTKIQYLTGYIFTLASFLLILRSLGAVLDVGVDMSSTNYLLILPLIFFLIINLIIPLLLIFILKEKDNLKLRDLNKGKDKFFSIIAHDLRGPLGGLQQIGELLWLNNITDEKREKLTKSLYQNSKNTFNLLDNLLKWANANAGLIIANPTSQNIHKIILTNIGLFKAQIKLKNLSLKSNLNDDFFVNADYDMLNVVIRNILSNAIKFTPNNGKIKINLVNVDKTSNKCTIAIIDTGIGINENSQLKVFEIDSMLSTLGTNKEKGTGLGLKLCKEFLAINNGDIWIESTVNIGTSIFISLPLELKK